MQNESFEILFKKLNFNDKNGLYYFHNLGNWKDILPFRIIRAVESIKPYAIYATKNENNVTPLIAFIDNSKNISIGELHPEIWHFQIPIVIIDDGNEYQIYNGQLLNKNRLLDELIGPIKQSELDKNTEIDIFSFWNLNSGQIWKKFINKFQENKIKKKLYTYLLENIEETIKILTAGKNRIDSDDNRIIANNLIGRLIFIRYLIDRNVKLNYKYINDKNARKDFENLILRKEKLYDFFSFLKSEDKFNGNLFPFYENDVEKEKGLVSDVHLGILQELFLGEKIKDRDKKQLSFVSLFDIYNFNMIPVELISNIYERFIGKEGQKIHNSFYTPPFLVDYVLKYTIEPHLENNNSCKVLDPACGSGIFLVETLRKIIEKNLKIGYLKTFKQIKNQAKGKNKNLSKLIKDNDKKLRELVTKNIFGIDKDPNAITIAIFSIYITILDYKEPKEIENFKLPELIDRNFFIKNFFDPEIDKLLKQNIKQKGAFSFIIGNPPWGSVTNDKLHNKFVEDNKEIISDNQIAQSFIIKSKEFCSENTKCALIVTSKILYNVNAKRFREFFIKNYKLNRVLELSSVRKQIFTGGIAPPSILFFEYFLSIDNSKNIVHYISLKPNIFFELFKIIVIEKYDYKKIIQKQLEKNWSWKTLLYGNQLDYQFFSYYYEQTGDKIDIRDFIEKNNLTFGTGYKTSQKYAKTNADPLKHYKVVKGDNLQSFFINSLNLKSFKELYPDVNLVDGKGVLKAYKAPHLLIKRGIKKRSVVAFADFYCVFPNTVYGISGNKDKSELLKALGIIFSSSFFAYLMFFKSSQWGVERNEVYKTDYEETQIIELTDEIIIELSKIYDNLEKYAKSDFDRILKQSNLEGLIPSNTDLKRVVKEFHKLIETEKKYNIDGIIYKLYNIDDEEQSLIDYALNVSIPLFEQKTTPFKTIQKTNKVILDYVNIFIEKNKEFANKINRYFCVDIYFDKRNYIIVNFKFEEHKPKKIISFHSKTNEEFELETILASPEQITTNLFIQKDVKGINEKSFYVIKPNEYKNWNPAVAYLDYYEFEQALLKAGQKKFNKENLS